MQFTMYLFWEGAPMCFSLYIHTRTHGRMRTRIYIRFQDKFLSNNEKCAILTVVRNTCCQLSVSIDFPVDRKLFVCIWYTCAPEAKELNPQAMCYRSTTLFRLDNIESLNERRKRDVHSIKSANISFSWGFLYVNRRILDNPKIVRKWSKW